jgi:hypothetical protein
MQGNLLRSSHCPAERSHQHYNKAWIMVMAAVAIINSRPLRDQP